MSVRLFVGNLPYQATEEDVRQHFSAVAPPMRVAIPLDRETGRPRGFAFIEFDNPAHAQEAIQRLNGQPFMGRNLAVNEARAREDRGPGGRPPMGPRPPMGARSPMGPRPMGGPGGPRSDGPGPGPASDRFGPPARRQRSGGAPRRDREESKPRGPIPVRYTGRVFDVDDTDDAGDTVEDLGDFDNFATSRPDTEPEGEDQE